MGLGQGHLQTELGKLLWSYLWIHHKYVFAPQWRTLSKFACFAMKGSQRRLQPMLRSHESLNLLRGKLALQHMWLVVDNRAIDDSLRCEGWGTT